jgi:hypothetical protein
VPPGAARSQGAARGPGAVDERRGGGPHLHDAELRAGALLGPAERGVEVGHVDDEDPGQRLLGLGERAVLHVERAAAQGEGGGRGLRGEHLGGDEHAGLLQGPAVGAEGVLGLLDGLLGDGARLGLRVVHQQQVAHRWFSFVSGVDGTNAALFGALTVMTIEPRPDRHRGCGWIEVMFWSRAPADHLECARRCGFEMIFCSLAPADHLEPRVTTSRCTSRPPQRRRSHRSWLATSTVAGLASTVLVELVDQPQRQVVGRHHPCEDGPPADDAPYTSRL